MASSRSKSTRSARSSTSKSKAKSARPARAQVEVVEEGDSGGLDAGLAIITTLLLVTGFFLLDYQLGNHYGEGVFFKDSYQAPQ